MYVHTYTTLAKKNGQIYPRLTTGTGFISTKLFVLERNDACLREPMDAVTLRTSALSVLLKLSSIHSF